nr:hypothetical protein [Tanacetum cinerariifolium]
MQDLGDFFPASGGVSDETFRQGCRASRQAFLVILLPQRFSGEAVAFPATFLKDSFLSLTVTVEVSYGGGDNVSNGGDVGGGKTWSVEVTKDDSDDSDDSDSMDEDSSDEDEEEEKEKEVKPAKRPVAAIPKAAQVPAKKGKPNTPLKANKTTLHKRENPTLLRRQMERKETKILSVLLEITLDLSMRAIETPLSSSMGTMWCLCDSTTSGKGRACVYFNFPFTIKLAIGLNVFLQDPSPPGRILLLQSGNPTFSLHKEITSSEVTFEIHDSKGCTFLSKELPDIDSFNDIHPHFDDDPLSGSTTYSSNSLLEEFTDELALITYPPDYDDNLKCDIESDLREIEFLLYQGEKIKEAVLLIDQLDLPCDILSEYDSFASQDFSRDDDLPSPDNKDKVKENSKKDKIESKQDKNEKRGEAEKSQKQLQ